MTLFLTVYLNGILYLWLLHLSLIHKLPSFCLSYIQSPIMTSESVLGPEEPSSISVVSVNGSMLITLESLTPADILTDAPCQIFKQAFSQTLQDLIQKY